VGKKASFTSPKRPLLSLTTLSFYSAEEKSSIGFDVIRSITSQNPSNQEAGSGNLFVSLIIDFNQLATLSFMRQQNKTSLPRINIFLTPSK
jgi:hypothetical protein